MTAFTRRPAPAGPQRITANFRATDDLHMRAANIVGLMGLSGDPEIIGGYVAVVRDALAIYREIDREAGR
jgi:hypothetical protein